MNLLLAAVLLMQDKTAEETLGKIEEAVDKARTVRVTYRTEAECVRSGAEKSTWTNEGNILVKGASRINASSNYKLIEGKRSEAYESQLISDGTNLLLHFPPSKKRVIDLQFFSIPQFQGSLVRAGVSNSMFLAGTFGDLLCVGGGGPKPKDFFELSKLKEGPKRERGKTLEYTLKYENERFPSHPTKELLVILEYDPVTWKLLSRKTKIQFEGGETTIRETYTDFILNADIPDEKFKLPEEKK